MEYLMLITDVDADGDAWHPRARTGHVVLYPTHALEFANPVR